MTQQGIIYQNVQLFIRSKDDILNAAVIKYSLHKVRDTNDTTHESIPLHFPAIMTKDRRWTFTQ